MSCVPWLSNPGGPLGVFGTNVIPIGCVGAPCQSSCADTYVKLIDILSWAGGGILLALGLSKKNKWLTYLGVLLIVFGVLSFGVFPYLSIPWITGPISLDWY